MARLAIAETALRAVLAMGLRARFVFKDVAHALRFAPQLPGAPSAFGPAMQKALASGSETQEAISAIVGEFSGRSAANAALTADNMPTAIAAASTSFLILSPHRCAQATARAHRGQFQHVILISRFCPIIVVGTRPAIDSVHDSR